MRGLQLIEAICTATDVPPELLKKEVASLIKKAGKSTDTISINELRLILSCYLQDVILKAKSSLD